MIGKGKKVTGALFMLPGAILLMGLIVMPIIVSVYYSFTDWEAIGTANWVGLKNYIKLFKTSEYLVSLKNNLIFFICAFVFQNTFAYFLALLINSLARGKRAFQSIIFMPVVVSSVATGFMFVVFLNGDSGMLNVLLSPFGIRKAWLSDGSTVLYAVIFTQLWQYIGIHFMIYYAAISNVSNEVLESASIDGANIFRTTFSITIPITWQTIITGVIFSFVGCLKSFDYPWIMTRGGPGTSSEYVGVYLFKQAFVQTNYGLACTVSITVLIFALIFTVLFKASAGRCFRQE